MSQPLLIAGSIVGVFLLIYIFVVWFVLHQVKQHAFLGDKTNAATRIFLCTVLFFSLLGALILLSKDWTVYPTL